MKNYPAGKELIKVLAVQAHLSQRIIGELIVYQ